MRKVIVATEGHILTDGEIYGRTIYLAEGVDGSAFHEVPEDEIPNLEEAEPEDYKTALSRLGVNEHE